MVKTKTWAIFSVLSIAVFTVAILAVRKISGGKETFLRVAEATKMNDFIENRVGTPVRSVEENDGPWEVSKGKDGRRYGYYSVKVVGSTSSELVKIYWMESPNGAVELYAIYKTAPFKADELLWGRPKPELL